MKKQVLYFLALILIIGVSSCKKDKDQTNDDNQMATHADDQSQFDAEIDAIANEAGAAVESSTLFTGRLQNIQTLICDATVAFNATSDPRTITITYDGSTCLGNRIRTGSVVISMAASTEWKNAGATIQVSFQNVKITRVRDNKSITINGTKTYTNVSGGLLKNLATSGTITHTITSDGINVKFDDGTQRSWKLAKQRVFTYSGGAVISTTGTHSEGGANHIAVWGHNRFGGSFATSTIEPVVVRQDCNFRLTSGKLQHVTNLSTGTVTFGLDTNGNATTCPAGSFYLKAIWTGRGGNTLTLILPY